MAPVRKILHMDLDAFFCAVEELHNPDLRGKAFAVGGRPDQRGVVASCSYPARQFGVRSAMPMATAVRLCPDLIIVSHRHGVYSQVSDQVMALVHDLTPVVEQLSIDEAFLDVTLRPERASELAQDLQGRINQELSLPVSLGVAANKLVAKIANNVGKAQHGGIHPPNTITVVPPGQEAAFLAPLSVRELWGVGPRTAQRLAELDIHSVGDIASRPAQDLMRAFGKHGADLAQRARGIDERPLETEHDPKSISKEVTFAQDIGEEASLRRVVRRLSDGVGRRLRRAGLQGTTVKIKLRWSDFTTLSRQITLGQPTDDDDVIYHAALELFIRNWPRGRPVRLIGVGISSFEAGVQLGLWGGPSEERRHLIDALDRLRDRFGDKSVRRGSDLIDAHEDEEA